ncbi:MAG: glycerophosphodiester phosphodiesterase family protein [Steroidobacteraceae bacterium]
MFGKQHPLECSNWPAGAPVVIGHRGASGYRPEHTLAAYELALLQGADALEPDLVMTRDGVLVVRHENELAGTTDVARHARFASRRVTKLIDGEAVTGWFSEDFTLEELKALRCRERIAQLRPDNTRFDGQFRILSLEELLRLRERIGTERRARAAALERPAPPPIGLYPELKHPTYFEACGLPMAEALLGVLEAHGLATADAPVFVESFEPGILRTLHALAPLRLVQLIESEGAPYDARAAGRPGTFAELSAPAGLAEVAGYAVAVGPEKSLVIPRDAAGRLTSPTRLVADSHREGLAVFPWTFRAENAFLPTEARGGGSAGARGDLEQEIGRFLAAGIDGFFTDQPDIGVRARDAFMRTATRP